MIKKTGLIFCALVVMSSISHSFELPSIGSKKVPTKNADMRLAAQALEQAVYSQGFNDGWKEKQDSDQWTTWIREIGYVVIIYKLASK